MDIGTITVPARFNGPPDSGNGGWVCGTVAGLVDGPVEVALRAPPPLDTPLTVVAEDGRLEVLHGDRLVATAVPTDAVPREVPRVVTLDEAADASSRYPFSDEHVFPTCWVCGPGRDGDGLRIFAGPVAGSVAVSVAGDGPRVAAGVWTPDAELADEDGAVRSEQVWAALDCPGYVGGAFPRMAVLGSLSATQYGPVRAGVPHVAMGWSTGAVDGRKVPAGSAVLAEDGSVLAVGRALWIEIPTPT